MNFELCYNARFSSQSCAAIVDERSCPRLPMVVRCIVHPVDRGTSRVKESLSYPGMTPQRACCAFLYCKEKARHVVNVASFPSSRLQDSRTPSDDINTDCRKRGSIRLPKAARNAE